MEKRGWSLPAMGVALAAGFVLSAFLLGVAVRKSVPSNQVVKVRGVAEEVIDLDRAEWTITIRVLNKDLKRAYRQVSQGADQVMAYLKKKSIDPQSIERTRYYQDKQYRRVYNNKKGAYDETFLGHQVSRHIKIKNSSQLDLIESLARDFGGEVQSQGVPAYPEDPFYFVSKDPVELKKSLLEKAAGNAYFRASVIAQNSHSSIGGLKAARQGDYTGIHSDGRVGGDKRRHRVTSLVTVDYALE